VYIFQGKGEGRIERHAKGEESVTPKEIDISKFERGVMPVYSAQKKGLGTGGGRVF